MIGNISLHSRRTLFIALATLFLTPAAVLADDARSPEQIVSTLVDAMAQNDADMIAAQFAENASQAYGQGSPRTGDTFRRWLQSDIIDAKGRVENAQLFGEGNTVVVTGRYRNDNGYSSDADFLFIVENQKIVQWTVR